MILEMAKNIQSRQPELTIDECIDIAADSLNEMQGDFEDIEHEE